MQNRINVGDRCFETQCIVSALCMSIHAQVSCSYTNDTTLFKRIVWITRSAAFAGLTTVTDRPTDHAIPSVATGRIYMALASAATRPKLARYVVHGRGCNPHRSLWRRWWRHNSETIRDREQELIRRWDSERELFLQHRNVEASAYAHWTSS